jgi:hypothetical protein
LDRYAIALALLVIIVLPGAAAAQSFRDAFAEQRYLEPMPTEPPEPAAPRMTFRLFNDIPLPGPLPDRGPRFVDGRIEIPVAGGIAVSGWLEESEPRIIPHRSSDDDAAGEWSYSPQGDFRCMILESGHILAQKGCRNCKKNWRKKWKLRIAGGDTAPPLLTENRVYHGGLDNRVYCLKRRNGHRMWESDAPGRVSQPLALWREDGVELIILAPDDGRSIIALDAVTGSRTAAFELPQNGGQLVGSPIVTDDGKIVVARQLYAADQASLMVFDLVEPGKSALSAPPLKSARR